MYKIIITSLLFLTFYGCSKTVNLTKTDCGYESIYLVPITCNGPVCGSDTCNTYFAIWKGLFLSKNQMSEAYFNNHISICSRSTFKSANQGVQFEVTYTLTIDWFKVQFREGFMILLDPAYLQSNPAINLPPNILLSRDQISTYINNAFFSNLIHSISSIEHLNYASRQEAMHSLAISAGIDNFCESSFWVQNLTTDNPPLGHPVLSARATLSWNDNSCVTGIMDLASDYIKTDRQTCVISFCFTGDNKIIQNNNRTTPIEKIRVGDTILSVNSKTLNIEKDIVKQVVSVKHTDMVHISFNDKTENVNTSDHPYYVKNKGWCSFKPLQTEQKYSIKTTQLVVGDTCLKFFDNHLTEIQIKDIREYPGEVLTYNISQLEKNASYFANGILVSNENVEQKK